MNVAQYKKKLKNFSVESSIEKSVLSSSDEIENLNRLSLSKGLNSRGKIVGYYSFFTQSWAKKNKTNKPKIAGSKYNFDWTGSFINGIFITYKNNIITFMSSGMGLAKKSRFINKNNLLGLNKSQSKEVNYVIVLPKLQNYFKKHLSK